MRKFYIVRKKTSMTNVINIRRKKKNPSKNFCNKVFCPLHLPTDFKKPLVFESRFPP